MGSVFYACTLHMYCTVVLASPSRTRVEGTREEGGAAAGLARKRQAGEVPSAQKVQQSGTSFFPNLYFFFFFSLSRLPFLRSDRTPGEGRSGEGGAFQE